MYLILLLLITELKKSLGSKNGSMETNQEVISVIQVRNYWSWIKVIAAEVVVGSLHIFHGRIVGVPDRMAVEFDRKIQLSVILRFLP